MNKLSRGEQEFLSEFNELAAEPAAPPAPTPAAPRKPRPGVAQEIDARPLSPPLPMLRAHRALRGMQPGELLSVLTSQPQTVAEFQAMVKFVPGYELVGQEEENGDYVHLLRKRR
jgi:tRNA 2-thiouridine synthesizing protein A